MTLELLQRKALATALFATLLAPACSETDAETYGTIGAAITTTGSDGATYRLADGAYVQVLNGDFNDTFSLDGDVAAVSFDVPVGSYSVYIGNYFGSLDLLRIASDGTPELVSAQLLTPLPLTVDVLADTTSNVAFQFRVNNGGTVTFGQGSINVEINVDAQDVLGGRALTVGDLNTDSVAADPLLQPRMPVVGEPVFHYLEVTAAPSWRKASANSACTTGTWSAYGITQPGYTDTVSESIVDGQIEVCVYGNAYAPWLRVSAYRYAASPQTATYADLGPSLNFYMEVGSALPQPAFDGETLDLGALEGSSGGLSGNVYQSVYRDDGSSVLQATYSGPVAFTFLPE